MLAGQPFFIVVTFVVKYQTHACSSIGTFDSSPCIAHRSAEFAQSLDEVARGHTHKYLWTTCWAFVESVIGIQQMYPWHLWVFLIPIFNIKIWPLPFNSIFICPLNKIRTEQSFEISINYFCSSFEKWLHLNMKFRHFRNWISSFALGWSVIFEFQHTHSVHIIFKKKSKWNKLCQNKWNMPAANINQRHKKKALSLWPTNLSIRL